MANEDKWLDTIEHKLSAQRCEVERVEQTLNVKAGRGITAAKANVDPAPLFEELRAADDDHERLIAGYVSGVKHVLLEPKRSDADEWDFLEAAGRMMLNVEVHTFALGAEAAAGEPAWTGEYFEDLIVGYFIELDVGIRVLTESQFERWPATSERVYAAARSMLFHKSRNLKPQELDDFAGVEELNAGDGYDAMRSIVVADLFFSEFGDDFRFSTPTQDALLFVRGDSDDHLSSLREATDAYTDEADYSLSRSVYGFETGKPVLVEPRQ